MSNDRDRHPAELFPPSHYLREELAARGWTPRDLAAVAGCDLQLVLDVLADRHPVTPLVAELLGAALGTGPQVWLNLQAVWDAHGKA